MGEQGYRLKERTSVDTGFSTKHNLALARRDAGQIQEALKSFLAGESLEAVVTPGERIPGKEAAFFGDIGRCLFLTNRMDEALVCCVKSAQWLEESRTHSDHNNKGYIRSWIADLLVQQEKFELAAASYRAAECIWNDSSPPRAAQAKHKLEQLVTADPELRTFP